MERGLKAVFAMVDLFTLGMATGGTKITELSAREALEFTCKTVAVEFGTNAAVCGIGALGEAFDWPVSVTIMLSLAMGIPVSCIGNKLLFKNAEGGVIREKVLDEDEWKSFRNLMTSEEAARYDKYWQDTITSISKGERPDPTTYLSQEYIDKHLAQFKNGVSYILPETDYDFWRNFGSNCT